MRYSCTPFSPVSRFQVVTLSREVLTEQAYQADLHRKDKGVNMKGRATRIPAFFLAHGGGALERRGYVSGKH